MFFSSTVEVKDYVAVNANFDWEDIKAQLSQGLSKFIMPAIGRTFAAQLLGAYQSGTLSAAESAAVDKVQAALAPYAVFLWVPLGYVQQSAMGIQEVSSENSSPARQWVTYDLRKALLDQAEAALEELLYYLEENAAAGDPGEFVLWQNSDAYTKLGSGLISSADELSAQVNVARSRRLFQSLKTYLARTERNYIRPVLGRALYDELVADKQAGVLTTEQERLLKEVQPALAYLMLSRAIPELSIEIGEEGIRLSSANNGFSQKNSASGSRGDAQLISAHQQSLQMDGEAMLDSLKEFLWTHEVDYPLFAESPLYRSDIRGDSWLEDTDPDDKMFVL